MAKGRGTLYSGNHSYVTTNHREISTLKRNSKKEKKMKYEREQATTTIASTIIFLSIVLSIEGKKSIKKIHTLTKILSHLMRMRFSYEFHLFSSAVCAQLISNRI